MSSMLYWRRSCFAKLGELSNFPADDQVLQKKPAYRDVYRAYIQFEVASKLSWQGGDDVYGARPARRGDALRILGIPNACRATLGLLDTSFDLLGLIELRQHGLNVAFKERSRMRSSWLDR